MPSQWLGLEIGLSGLRASQRALDVIGHNVANANTKGYSRQAVHLTAQYPLNVPEASQPGQLGQGVRILPNIRYRDAYLDLQYRRQAANHGYAEGWVRVFDQLEGIFSEPNENGLQTQFTRFWDALQELANRPSATDARAQVVEAGRTLVLVVQGLDRQLRDLSQSLDDELVLRTQEVNELAAEIASLNEQIVKVQATGQTAHDLEDRRDLALDRLAELVGATWTVDGQNLVTVYVPDTARGSHALVHGFKVDTVQASIDGTTGRHVFSWTSDPNTTFSFASGKLGALHAARDEAVPRYWGYLETMVRELVTRFNAQHIKGYLPDGTQGGVFFKVVTTSSGNLDLQKLSLAVGPDGVAAAGPPPWGSSVPPESDGRNAAALAQLVQDPIIQNHPLTGSGDATLDEFYRAFVGQLGIEARYYRGAEETFRALLQQAENQRKSESGVSLDEEMTRMIQYQQAYSAAARVITTMDEILDTLINRTGVVGR